MSISLYLCDRSYFMEGLLPLRTFTSVHSSYLGFRIVLDQIKMTSPYCMGVHETSTLSISTAVHVF